MCYTLSMSKITDYLNEHITGDVVATDNVRKQFATDGSILSLTPNLVAYPRIADDVRKVARFAWRLAERGQVLPITPRGNGTDVTGRRSVGEWRYLSRLTCRRSWSSTSNIG